MITKNIKKRNNIENNEEERIITLKIIGILNEINKSPEFSLVK